MSSDVELLTESDYFQKLDTSTPGLFVAKVCKPVPAETYKVLREILQQAVQRYSPESTVLLLPDFIQSMNKFDEAEMKKLGWVREKK